jgi:hypothetical protein
MTYRRAFENLDRSVRKKLEGLNEERENIIHELDSKCRAFYDQIAYLEHDLDALNSLKEFRQLQSKCESSQSKFRKNISESLDHQLHKIIAKIKALDSNFKEKDLQLRMNSKYDPNFKSKKMPLYQNLIETLRIVTHDCEKKFIEDFKHWQENAINETKSWIEKFYSKSNKKQGYLELMESIEKTLKQSKLHMRALMLRCETAQREIVSSLEIIPNKIEAVNIESVSILQICIFKLISFLNRTEI